MKTSELIEHLQQLIAEHGDVDIVAPDGCAGTQDYLAATPVFNATTGTIDIWGELQ